MHNVKNSEEEMKIPCKAERLLQDIGPFSANSGRFVHVMSSFNAQFRFTSVSNSANSVLQFAPRDLIGRSFLTLLSKDDASRLATGLENMPVGSGADFEAVMHCGDGQERDFSWKVSKREDGTYYCIARDITERCIIARAKRRLIAVAGHDLRTPLSAISSSLSLLQSGVYGDLSPGTIERLKRADTNLERLMDLIRDLLELARLESGKLNLQFTCVSALDVCILAMRALAPIAKSAHVRLLAPGSDASIKADERLVLQILISFIALAIRSAHAGSQICLSVSANKRYVEFSVTGDSQDIPREYKNLICEDFSQIKTDSAASESFTKSHCLTLAIARTLILLHGGDLGAKAKIGAGCRLWFTIPAFDVDERE